MGTAISIAIREISNVPANIGIAPKELVLGFQWVPNRKSKNGISRKKIRLPEYRKDNTDRGEDRDDRTENQDHPEDAFDPVSCLQFGGNRSPCNQTADDRQHENDDKLGRTGNGPEIGVVIGCRLDFRNCIGRSYITGCHVLDVVDDQTEFCSRELLCLFRQVTDDEFRD